MPIPESHWNNVLLWYFTCMELREAGSTDVIGFDDPLRERLGYIIEGTYHFVRVGDLQRVLDDLPPGTDVDTSEGRARFLRGT